MKVIALKTPAGLSEIFIEKGLFGQLGDLLGKSYPDSRLAVIIDTHLERIYGERLKAMLPDALFLPVPAGEGSKSFERVMELSEKLLNHHFARYDVIVGFGGGMLTDLAGFVASVYMRGVNYVAVPTSLLGMVDAAIGGKTGIDFHAKNSIGTLYLANQVFIDPDLLNSFKNAKEMPGMAEVIKYGAIMDADLFEYCQRDEVDLFTIIERSVRAKVEVVSEDSGETGRRKILNFGHTFGHAIEAETHYQCSHDHAVAIGMGLANKVAQQLGKQRAETGEKIKATLEKFHLPTEMPNHLLIDHLVEWIKKDKKCRGELIDFVVVPSIGMAELVPMKVEELADLVKGFY